MAVTMSKWAVVLLIAAVVTPADGLSMPTLAVRSGRLLSLRSSVRSMTLRSTVKMSVSRREAIATAFTAAITLIPSAFPSAVLENSILFDWFFTSHLKIGLYSPYRSLLI
jgi:hypothetical protein